MASVDLEAYRSRGGTKVRRAVRKRSFRELLREVLNTPLPEGDSAAEELSALGLPANHEYAIALAAAKKAKGGDIVAAKFLRDALEEKEASAPPPRPVRSLELSRLSDEELSALADRGD